MLIGSDRVSIMKLGVPSPIQGAPAKVVGEIYYEKGEIGFEGDVNVTAASVLNSIMLQCRLQIMKIAMVVVEDQEHKLKARYIQIEEKE